MSFFRKAGLFLQLVEIRLNGLGSEVRTLQEGKDDRLEILVLLVDLSNRLEILVLLKIDGEVGR